MERSRQPDEKRRSKAQKPAVDSEQEHSAEQRPTWEVLQQLLGNTGVGRYLRVHQEAAAEGVTPISSDTQRAIDTQRYGGRALDAGLNDEMETALGVDLSDVRLHDDRDSQHLAKGLNANAFTQGREVFLGRGRGPDSPAGRETLAHELTHVAQGQTGPGTVQRQEDDEEEPERQVSMRLPGAGEKGQVYYKTPAQERLKTLDEFDRGMPSTGRLSPEEEALIELEGETAPPGREAEGESAPAAASPKAQVPRRKPFPPRLPEPDQPEALAPDERTYDLEFTIPADAWRHARSYNFTGQSEATAVEMLRWFYKELDFFIDNGKYAQDLYIDARNESFGSELAHGLSEAFGGPSFIGVQLEIQKKGLRGEAAERYAERRLQASDWPNPDMWDQVWHDWLAPAHGYLHMSEERLQAQFAAEKETEERIKGNPLVQMGLVQMGPRDRVERAAQNLNGGAEALARCQQRWADFLQAVDEGAETVVGGLKLLVKAGRFAANFIPGGKYLYEGALDAATQIGEMLVDDQKSFDWGRLTKASIKGAVNAFVGKMVGGRASNLLQSTVTKIVAKKLGAGATDYALSNGTKMAINYLTEYGSNVATSPLGTAVNGTLELIINDPNKPKDLGEFWDRFGSDLEQNAGLEGIIMSGGGTYVGSRMNAGGGGGGGPVAGEGPTSPGVPEYVPHEGPSARATAPEPVLPPAAGIASTAPATPRVPSPPQAGAGLQSSGIPEYVPHEGRSGAATAPAPAVPEPITGTEPTAPARVPEAVPEYIPHEGRSGAATVPARAVPEPVTGTEPTVPVRVPEAVPEYIPHEGRSGAATAPARAVPEPITGTEPTVPARVPEAVPEYIPHEGRSGAATAAAPAVSAPITGTEPTVPARVPEAVPEYIPHEGRSGAATAPTQAIPEPLSATEAARAREEAVAKADAEAAEMARWQEGVQRVREQRVAEGTEAMGARIAAREEARNVQRIDDIEAAARIFVEQTRAGHPGRLHIANADAFKSEWRSRHQQPTNAPAAYRKADGGIVIDASNPQMMEAVERLARTLPVQEAGGTQEPIGSARTLTPFEAAPTQPIAIEPPEAAPALTEAGAPTPGEPARANEEAPPAAGGGRQGRGRVLALGHYQRDVGGQKQPAGESLINEAEAASGGHAIMLFGVAPDGQAQFEALAPSSLASSALMQPALAGENGITAIYINVEAGPVTLLPEAATAPQRAEVGIGGTYQTGGEYRSLIPAIAAGDHKVDIYIRHEGGLSIIRAGSQQVEGAPLPAELAPHLPPSFRTENPEAAASRAAAREEAAAQAELPAVPAEIRDEVTARISPPQPGRQAGARTETPTQPLRVQAEDTSPPRLTPAEEAAIEILPAEAAKPGGPETQATEAPRTSGESQAAVDPRVTATADFVAQAMASGGPAAVRQATAAMSDGLLVATAAELFVQARRATTTAERQRLSQAAAAAWQAYAARPLPGERR